MGRNKKKYGLQPKTLKRRAHDPNRVPPIQDLINMMSSNKIRENIPEWRERHLLLNRPRRLRQRVSLRQIIPERPVRRQLSTMTASELREHTRTIGSEWYWVWTTQWSWDSKNPCYVDYGPFGFDEDTSSSDEGVTIMTSDEDASAPVPTKPCRCRSCRAGPVPGSSKSYMELAGDWMSRTRYTSDKVPFIQPIRTCKTWPLARKAICIYFLQDSHPSCCWDNRCNIEGGEKLMLQSVAPVIQAWWRRMRAWRRLMAFASESVRLKEQLALLIAERDDMLLAALLPYCANSRACSPDAAERNFILPRTKLGSDA